MKRLRIAKPLRSTLVSCGILLVLLGFVTLSALFIAQTGWFRDKVRDAIVEQTETATGGRVEISSIQLDWTGLTATVSGFVLHGKEPPGRAPLLAVDHVTIGLSVISWFSRDVRLERIEVSHPRVHVIVDADGGTNLPRPKVPGNTRTSDAILDLKIAQVAVHDGEALVESPGAPPRTYPWSGSGRNLAVRATWDPSRDRYAGDVSFAPVHLTLEGYGPLDVDVSASAAMERNQVVVSKAQVKSAASQIDLRDLTIGSFASPVALAKYDVKVSVAEAAKVLHWKLPISGVISVSGNVRYVNPGEFSVSGAFGGAGLAYGPVHNIRLTGNVAGDQRKMALTSLRASLLGGSATGSAETNGYDVYRLNGTIAGLAVRDLAALGTPKPVPYDGLVAGSITASGRLTRISRLNEATAQLTVSPAPSGPAVNGEISAQYNGATAKLEMAHSWVQLPHTRADVTGTLGNSLAVKLDSGDLNDLLPALNGHALPFELRNGTASFAGSVNGPLDSPRISGHVAIRNAVFEGRLYDSLSGDAVATENQLAISNAALSADGVTANGAASLALTAWEAGDNSAIAASLSAGKIALAPLLAAEGYKDQPVSGTVDATARVAGTLARPTGNADVTLSKGLLYDQPFDSIAAHIQYASAGLQTMTGTFASGPKRVAFDVSYAQSKTLQIAANSNTMALNQIALIRERQPDIAGTAQFRGTATVRVTRDAANALRFDLTALNGDASANAIALAGRDLGDAHLTARTLGTTLTASMDSNAAKATIKGEAQVELVGDDRATGSITFSNAGLNAIGSLFLTEADAKYLTFDGATEGRVDFRGPLFTPSAMSATATVNQIEVHPLPSSPLAKTIPGFSLHNDGALRLSYDKATVRVDAAHFEAPQTDLTVSGSAEARAAGSPLNLRMQGEVSLAMLRNFVPDLAASGAVAVNGYVRGTWSAPDFGGLAGIRNGEFHFADFTNGLTNATGEIVFSGNRATIRSFTAESGGGKLTGTGFATVDSTGALAFQFSAKTKDVRLRYPQGVSSISDSDIQLVRNAQRSSISGTISVRRLVFNPEQDTAATLADLSRNARAPVTGDNSLANMNLDVLIQTTPDVALQSRVAESIQGDATLRLRGTVASPALLGRINVSQGGVLFFGNKYNITRGAISFFNPTRIDPILDVDLQTRARGVDVTLTVTGPPSNLGMTYRSDPPLEFSDIVALLATGRTPDDPSVALRGNAPTPSFEQLGASALIGQTIANPVAGRLQRFFGVSRIKIDPQLSGVGGNPGARLTVEQQVTPDILFTYITDVSNTSQQLIRVEWAFNPRWSAVLEREENGYVGVDFTYKKRLK